MSVKQGDRAFADRIARADRIVVVENWCGWSVTIHRDHIDRYLEPKHYGPFRYKRDAVAWLKSWGFVGPLRNPDGEPGLWVWTKEPQT